ncbi:hypothetical protein MJA45_14285 [Paenibacillus aurantius]|uniref:Uncharacterized protein n=1 Tax=Paenibacillus aurantius TaxID=2918900 RepID=A0AA96LAJ4_9BACL|nr:hypothetical protein [Paenibacillus aurantius]WNQ08825.1 hypothetical protein MJA45_14285 [Paenibacillus aurantius]
MQEGSSSKNQLQQEILSRNERMAKSSLKPVLSDLHKIFDLRDRQPVDNQMMVLVRKMIDQLLQIEGICLKPGMPMISLIIIQGICTELGEYHVLHDRKSSALAYDIRDIGPQSGYSIQDSANLFLLLDNPYAPFFMVPARHVLKAMGIRSMPDIVQKSSHSREFSFISGNFNPVPRDQTIKNSSRIGVDA